MLLLLNLIVMQQYVILYHNNLQLRSNEDRHIRILSYPTLKRAIIIF